MLSNTSWGKKEQGGGSPWRGQTPQCPSSLLLASQQLHLKGPHQHPPSHQPAAGLSGSQEEGTSQGTSKPFACCWPSTCRDRGDLPRNSQAMCLLLPYQHLWQKRSRQLHPSRHLLAGPLPSTQPASPLSPQLSYLHTLAGTH